MSQHDFDIANQGFAAFRADLNNALKALGSLSSATAEPATTYANQLWYETDTNTLHIRNEANSAWLDLMVIDQTTGSPSFAAGDVGIGTSSPDAPLHLANGTSADFILEDSGAATLTAAQGKVEFQRNNDVAFGGLYVTDGTTDLNISTKFSGGSLTFGTDTGGERLRIDSSGTVLIGKTTADSGATSGIEFEQVGLARFTRASTTAVFDRLTTDGVIVSFRRDGTAVGDIGSLSASSIYFGNGDTTLTCSASGDAIVPSGTGGVTRSGAIDLGNSGNRWDTVFATVGTINTSDRTEKQDIEELNDAERRVAVACKGLLRKYRLKSAIAKKGEDARIHFGIIAQDLQAAFEAEGLDAGRYGMFINSTWTEEETGEEKSLMGVRYSELLAFMISVL